MSRAIEPDDSPEILVRGEWKRTKETHADITLSPLTSEVLRDIARNESASKSWRKAAVRFLIKRDSPYQHHSDYKEIRDEILEEMKAEAEVRAAVESAIEEPLEE